MALDQYFLTHAVKSYARIYNNRTGVLNQRNSST
jgi:hypothetical protein